MKAFFWIALLLTVYQPLWGQTSVRQAWESIKESENLSELQAFVNRFPTSHYMPFAWLKVRRLANTTTRSLPLSLSQIKPLPLEPQQEQDLWALVEHTRDPIELNFFLRVLPQSSFEALAEQRLNLLKSVPQGFVLIEPGTFQRENKPPGQVGIWNKVILSKAFFLSDHEVTLAEYHQFDPTHGSNKCEQSDCPVSHMTWDDTQRYIAWLNEKEGEEVYRLPTEAEWEYAARAGTTTHYSCGDDARCLDEHAWYFENSGGAVHPVKTKKPNPWQLYDMHGNVWEWVADWFAPYPPDDPIIDPLGPPSGHFRVRRGGDMTRDPFKLQHFIRGRGTPDTTHPGVGFRVAKRIHLEVE